LAILQFISLAGKRVIDIGSGAGFPAIILAMHCEDAQFVLVESDLKKSSFLESCRLQLNLKNVQVVRARAEEIGHDKQYRAQFDCCSSRAVAAMNILLEYGLPLLKTGGKMLLWKGLNYQAELETAQHALQVLRAGVEGICPYTLPGDRQRIIVVVNKQAETSPQYPRRVGIPAKRPL
jgi:16S rRNA (guanine527-N7)-methyltransferase